VWADPSVQEMLQRFLNTTSGAAGAWNAGTELEIASIPRIAENPVSQTRDTREVPNTRVISTRAVFDTGGGIITVNRATPTSE